MRRLVDLWERHPTTARVVLVVLLGVAVLLPRLGATLIIHSDEGHYVGAALQAMEHGEWVVPLEEGHFNRTYGKPPLNHALIALSCSMFGVNKFAFRLPFVLAGLAALALVIFHGERWRRNAGLWAALVLLSAPGWAEHTRRIWLETLVVPFDLGAILLLGADRRRPAVRRLLGAACLFAAALMTKQLAAGFGLAATLIADVGSTPRRWKRALVVLAVALAPLVVWAFLLVHRVGADAESVWSFHVVRGVFEGHAHQARRLGDYLKGLHTLIGLGGVVVGLAGVGLLTDRAQRGPNEIECRALLVLLGLSVIVVGLLSRSYRLWYSFPAAYVLALAAGLLIAVGLEAAMRDPRRHWPLVLVVSIGFVALQWQGNAHEAWPLAGGVLLIAGVALFGRRIPDATLGRALAPVAIGALLLVYGSSFRHNVLEIRPDPLQGMADRLRAEQLDAVVAEPSFYQEEFIFYLAGLPLLRAPRGNVCTPAPPGARYAYLANTRKPPGCWQGIPGTTDRIRFYSLKIMPVEANER